MDRSGGHQEAVEFQAYQGLTLLQELTRRFSVFISAHALSGDCIENTFVTVTYQVTCYSSLKHVTYWSHDIAGTSKPSQEVPSI